MSESKEVSFRLKDGTAADYTTIEVIDGKKVRLKHVNGVVSTNEQKVKNFLNDHHLYEVTTEAKEQIATLEEHIQLATEQIEDLNAELKKKDEVIEGRDADVERLEKVITGMKEEQSSIIVSLRKENEELKQKIEALKEID
jgi:chromosome segregation ATPase